MFEGLRQSEVHAGVEPEAVRIWLLGGFKISVGSRTIAETEWRLRKAATLAKLLALAPNHRLYREQAIDLLWPNLARKAASNNLRQAVHTARRAFDPTAGSRYLQSKDKSLVLCPESSLRVDVEVFEEAAATARHARNPAAYRAALDLYVGDLLPEDRYDEWVEKRRQELRRLYLALLVELAELYEEHGEHGRAIETLQRAVTEEPILAEAHASLMRLYALSGRHEQALAQYNRLRETLSEQLGTKPSAATRRLRDEIADGMLPLTTPAQEKLPDAGKHNLPAPGTNFVGREREIVDVKRMLAMTGLLTLTGTGGCGKTRLALEVVRDLIRTYPDGVWMVELAPLSDGALVPQAVAATLGVREQPGRPLLDTLLDSLRDKEMLLILDNCEHLIDAAARLTKSIIDSCPHLRVLTTSRKPLGVAGELSWPVPSLSTPGAQQSPTVAELEGYESARLFADRASNRHPGFDITPENATAVALVCAELDGIPLAIELAAARVGMLSAEQISERLGHSLKLLTGGDRTADHRHRTLQAALDWSYELLSELEQVLFRRLATFAGGFTLEAAESVGAGRGIEQEDVLNLLSTLVDNSLVVAEESWERGARYRLLEPDRQYAHQRLKESEETEVILRRHAAFFLALAEEAKPELRRAQQRAWFERLEAEHGNLRAALSWALESEEAELAQRMGAALWRFWARRNYWREGRRWLKEALAQDSAVAASVRAEALYGAGRLADIQTDLQGALALYEHALSLYRETDNRNCVALCHADLGWIALQQGDYERATKLLQESLSQLREMGNSPDVADTLVALGTIAEVTNDLTNALVLYEEALTLYRKIGDSGAAGLHLERMGWLVLAQGNQEWAMQLFEEGLAQFQEAGVALHTDYLADFGIVALLRGEQELAKKMLEDVLASNRKLGYERGIAYGLERMAMVAGVQVQVERAARLWGAANSLREALNHPLMPTEHMVFEPLLAAARAHGDNAAWASALAEGRAMTPEEAVEYALSEEEPAPSTVSAQNRSSVRTQATPLTRREEEIAALVVRGLTNRQIATELSISEHTVANHVAKILRKLGLGSRSQITTWVVGQRTIL
jgi:predicted ATPase/DNA-binding SARP family transcriptional activator/DNA-binding CsgD family transcriptional regulator